MSADEECELEPAEPVPDGGVQEAPMLCSEPGESQLVCTDCGLPRGFFGTTASLILPVSKTTHSHNSFNRVSETLVAICPWCSSQAPQEESFWVTRSELDPPEYLTRDSEVLDE